MPSNKNKNSTQQVNNNNPTGGTCAEAMPKPNSTSSIQQPSILPCSDETKNEQDIPCKHKGMTVKKIDNAKRNYVLSLPITEKNTEPIIEILAGHSKPTKMICETNIEAGPCSDHQNKIFDLYPQFNIDGKKVITTKTNQKLEFDAYCKPIDISVFSIPSIIKNIWPYNAKTENYQVRTSSHQGESLSAEIIVRPNLKWKASASIGLNENLKLKKNPKSSEETLKRDTGVELKLSYTYQEVEIEAGSKFKEIIENLLNFIENVGKLTSYVLEKAGNISYEYQYPTLNFEGNWGWEEIESNYKCAYFYSITGGFSPLLGISATSDMIDVIVSKCTAVGAVIIEIKKRIEKGEHFKGEIHINLNIEGKVSLLFNFKKQPNQINSEKDAKYNGEIKLSLEGEIKGSFEAENRFFAISAGSGAKIGAESKLIDVTVGAYDDASEIGLLTSLSFGGLEIYYLVYAEMEVSFFSNNTPKNKEKKSTSGELNRKRRAVVIEPLIVIKETKKPLFSSKK